MTLSQIEGQLAVIGQVKCRPERNESVFLNIIRE
jgi:hypothetical protein